MTSSANPSLGQALAAARSLVLYRGIRKDPVCGAMLAFLAGENVTEAYAELFGRLADAAGTGDAWQDHLIDLVLYDDNPFTRAAAADRLAPSLREAARGDLRRLQALYRVEAAVARAAAGADLPLWCDLGPARAEEDGGPIRALLREAPDWALCVGEVAAYHRRAGAGPMARYRAFRWAEGLEGIAEPDPVTLDDLIGYRAQRQAVLANTDRFLAGLPANNLLLYGDRGTGKSSTVKALLHRYGGKGLRLVEVRKDDLAAFPRIVRDLRRLPQRFVLFVDDLSFEEDETAYKEIKAALEGGLESRPENVLVYATSNRRHLVRERFTDREDDEEVRPGDTLQEKLSLADRFGVTVLFPAPDRDLYLEIVRGLAVRRGVTLPEEELVRRALLWEAWHNGRSGRSARQFADSIGE